MPTLWCMQAQSCPTLLWPHGLCSPPGSSIHGILQARILEWVAICYSRGSSRPRDGNRISCSQILYYWAAWEAPYLWYFLAISSSVSNSEERLFSSLLSWALTQLEDGKNHLHVRGYNLELIFHFKHLGHFLEWTKKQIGCENLKYWFSWKNTAWSLILFFLVVLFFPRYQGLLWLLVSSLGYRMFTEQWMSTTGRLLCRYYIFFFTDWRLVTTLTDLCKSVSAAFPAAFSHIVSVTFW